MRDEAYDHADPYADGTYGTNSTPASTQYEHDKHEEFTHQQTVVLAIAEDAEWEGFTGADVKRITGWDSNVKSRAMSNLLRDGHLVRLKETRGKAHIHVLPAWVGTREIQPYVSTNTKHRLAALREAHDIVAGSDTYYEALLALEELITAAEES